MSVPTTIIVNPHFKGLIDYPSLNALTVVTGLTTIGEVQRRVSSKQYLEAVRKCAEECPALAQTLARSVAAAIFAIELMQTHRVCLVSVEGCYHRLGPCRTLGSHIVSTIWDSIVAPYHALPETAIGGGHSCCTVEESRLLVAECALHEGHRQIQCFTHAYHRSRVDATLRDAIGDAGAAGTIEALGTLTPEDLLREHEALPAATELVFLHEVIAAATVSPAVLKAEERKERWCRRLYRMSRFLERWTGGKVRIEQWLASRRRNALRDGK